MQFYVPLHSLQDYIYNDNDNDDDDDNVYHIHDNDNLKSMPEVQKYDVIKTERH